MDPKDFPQAASGFGWTYVELKDALPTVMLYLDKGAQVPATIPAGSTVRVYGGKIPLIQADGKTTLLQSPDPQMGYLIETLPDATSIGWSYYPNEARYTALMASPEYTAEKARKARSQRLYWASKLETAEAKPDLVDIAKAQQLDQMGVPPAPETPASGSGGSGGSGSDEETEFPWLAVGLGVGLAALIAMLVGKDDKGKVKKGKGKRGRRRRAARRRARRSGWRSS